MHDVFMERNGNDLAIPLRTLRLGLLRRFGRCARTGRLVELLANTRRFTRTLAKVIKLRAADVAAALQFHARDERRVGLERPFHPFAPGGIADFAARSVSQRLSESLGVPVVIDNRPGAGGIPGSDIVAKAPADGYTVLITSISHTINLSVNKNCRTTRGATSRRSR